MSFFISSPPPHSPRHLAGRLSHEPLHALHRPPAQAQQGGGGPHEEGGGGGGQGGIWRGRGAGGGSNHQWILKIFAKIKANFTCSVVKKKGEDSENVCKALEVSEFETLHVLFNHQWILEFLQNLRSC